jgi:copper homeostasis protein
LRDSGILFESCLDSVEAAIASERGGAGRLELCAGLDVAGLTPPIELVQACTAAVTIPVRVMVRPRAGQFIYDRSDVDVMVRTIGKIAAAGASGIVTGALRPNATVDVDAMRRLIDAVGPLPVTFHRAIDATRDLDEALDALMELGVDRVLTSGGASTALEGVETIARLVARAGDRVTIIAGGSVRANNVAEIVRRTGVRDVHAWIGRPVATRADWEREVRSLVRAMPRSTRPS